MDRIPFIGTPRILLRKLEPEDFPALVKHANNPKIAERIVNIPYPYREPDAAFRLAFIHNGLKDKQRYIFALFHKENQEFIGEAGLHFLDENQPGHLQLSYWLGEEFWNQGIITEVIPELVSFGFEKLNADSIFATTVPDNVGSQKVLLKNGFERWKNQDEHLLYVVERKTL
jgi:RimJ/RimL family protein N-acetyltransferase